MLGHRDGNKDELKRQPAAPRADLAGMGFTAFSAWCRELVGHHPRFHRAAYRQLMQDGRWAPAEVALWREAEATCPGTVKILEAAATPLQRPAVVGERTAEDPEHGQTVKLQLRLHDGREIESVLIPMGRGAHHTVCVSTQVGCKMGCTFCQTARMGLVRQLRAHEIVGQLLAVAAHTGVTPRNLVFMGMGEPLDNLEEVACAVAVLTDSCGVRLAERHITISTVGRVDQFPRLAELGLLRVNLAVSLSAPDDALRSRLMPVNRSWDLAALKQALLALPLPRARRLLISYVLIDGVNDSPAQAGALAAWISGLRAQVNLIPLNPIPGSHQRPTAGAARDRFRDHLLAAGVEVRLRATKGDGVMAACGQLGTARPRPRPAQP